MKKLFSMLVVSLLVLSMVLVPLIHAEGATIWTDKANYSPEETVIIYGSGFLEGAVTITVTRPESSTNVWVVTSDSSGSFTTTYLLDGIEGVYTVAASDGTNTATTTFIDGLTYTPDRYPTTGSATVAAGSSISFTITLSDTAPGKNPTTYTLTSLAGITGWTHIDDAWVTTDPHSFAAGPGYFTQMVTVTIAVPSDATLGGHAAKLKYTPREGDGCDIYITVTSLTATVTFGQVGVDTDFTGTVLTVDDTDYWGVSNLPKTYTWNIGSSHTFAYSSPLVVSAGKQYVWTSTSGLSTAQSGSITVPSGDGSVTGNYKTQYYLTVTSPYDTPSGEGWYDKNTNAYAHLATGTVVITPGWVQAVFTDWDADATGTNYAQSDPIHMDGPKTAVANWKIQYYLKVVSDPSEIPPMPGADWYDYCTHVTLTADAYSPSEAGVGGVRYRFDYWDVDGTSQDMGFNPIDVHMDTYHTATAHYVLQYLVTFAQTGLDVTATGTVVTVDTAIKAYGNLPFSKWVDTGTLVYYSYEGIVLSSTSGKRFRLDTVTGPISPITVTGLTSVTGNYVTQYCLTVNTAPSGINTPTGGGWYDVGTYASISTDGYVGIDAGSRWRFNGWTTTVMSEITAPNLLSTTVLMDKAKTVTANYVKQYFLTVQIDPSGLTPAPTPASDWYDEGSDVTETAHRVTGYIFVYWDVDGASQGVLNNPITVHMDDAHTATAHYWLELGFKNYITGSNFNVIDHFDTVFTPQDTKKTKFKLSATNPGQFMYNIEVTNTWPVPIDSLTITWTIPGDFVVKGADPIQVWTGYGKTGTRIPAIISGSTLTIHNIAAGTTVYATFHIEYKYTGQIFSKADKDAWKTMHGSPLLNGKYTFGAGYTAVWDGLTATASSSTVLDDPTVTLGE
jgi:hypothetical protein